MNRTLGAERKMTAAEIQCDAAKVKAGLKGNLIIQLSGKGKGQGNNRGNSMASLPAIPFEVVQGEMTNEATEGFIRRYSQITADQAEEGTQRRSAVNWRLYLDN